MIILGSNWQLSIAELDNVLKNSNFKGKIIDYSANIAVVQFTSLHEDKHYMNKLMELQFMLGGCQKIAQIHDFIGIHTVSEGFPSRIEKFKLMQKNRDKISSIIEGCLPYIFPSIKNESIFFAVSIYPNLFDDDYYSEVLVKHFLPFLNKEIMRLTYNKEAKKSLYYKYPEKNIKSGNLNPIFPHHLIKYGLFNRDRAEIIFGFTEEGCYIARTITSDDPNFKKKIDEERPFKEYKSSISPKLAIMMLNFLNLYGERENYQILDPFVGNGTILLFALLEGFQIYGSDKDSKKVNNTIRNLTWLIDELEEEIPYYLNKRILISDISEIMSSFQSNFFDGICTEPSLGPYFKSIPYYTEIKELIESELEPLYEDLFSKSSELLKPKGRICITAPIFSTVDGGDLQINIEKLANRYDLNLIPMIDSNRIVNKSNIKLQFKKKHVRTIIDAKKDQVVKRKLYVFEKQE